MLSLIGAVFLFCFVSSNTEENVLPVYNRSLDPNQELRAQYSKCVLGAVLFLRKPGEQNTAYGLRTWVCCQNDS